MGGILTCDGSMLMFVDDGLESIVIVQLSLLIPAIHVLGSGLAALLYPQTSPHVPAGLDILVDDGRVYGFKG